MLKAYQEKHQQEQQLKNLKSSSSLNLKWAESTKIQQTRVKSLAEIQAEEQESMLKVSPIVILVLLPNLFCSRQKSKFLFNLFPFPVIVGSRLAGKMALRPSGGRGREGFSPKTSVVTKRFDLTYCVPGPPLILFQTRIVQ